MQHQQLWLGFPVFIWWRPRKTEKLSHFSISHTSKCSSSYGWFFSYLFRGDPHHVGLNHSGWGLNVSFLMIEISVSWSKWSYIDLMIGWLNTGYWRDDWIFDGLIWWSPWRSSCPKNGEGGRTCNIFLVSCFVFLLVLVLVRNEREVVPVIFSSFFAWFLVLVLVRNGFIRRSHPFFLCF